MDHPALGVGLSQERSTAHGAALVSGRRPHVCISPRTFCTSPARRIRPISPDGPSVCRVFILKAPRSSPLRGYSACAKRAAYPDPVAVPESSGRKALLEQQHTHTHTHTRSSLLRRAASLTSCCTTRRSTVLSSPLCMSSTMMRRPTLNTSSPFDVHDGTANCRLGESAAQVVVQTSCRPCRTRPPTPALDTCTCCLVCRSESRCRSWHSWR